MIKPTHWEPFCASYSVHQTSFFPITITKGSNDRDDNLDEHHRQASNLHRLGLQGSELHFCVFSICTFSKRFNLGYFFFSSATQYINFHNLSSHRVCTLSLSRPRLLLDREYVLFLDHDDFLTEDGHLSRNTTSPPPRRWGCRISTLMIAYSESCSSLIQFGSKCSIFIVRLAFCSMPPSYSSF